MRGWICPTELIRLRENKPTRPMCNASLRDTDQNYKEQWPHDGSTLNVDGDYPSITQTHEADVELIKFAEELIQKNSQMRNYMGRNDRNTDSDLANKPKTNGSEVNHLFSSPLICTVEKNQPTNYKLWEKRQRSFFGERNIAKLIKSISSAWPTESDLWCSEIDYTVGGEQGDFGKPDFYRLRHDIVQIVKSAMSQCLPNISHDQLTGDLLVKELSQNRPCSSNLHALYADLLTEGMMTNFVFNFLKRVKKTTKIRRFSQLVETLQDELARILPRKVSENRPYMNGHNPASKAGGEDFTVMYQSAKGLRTTNVDNSSYKQSIEPSSVEECMYDDRSKQIERDESDVTKQNGCSGSTITNQEPPAQVKSYTRDSFHTNSYPEKNAAINIDEIPSISPADRADVQPLEIHTEATVLDLPIDTDGDETSKTRRYSTASNTNSQTDSFVGNTESSGEGQPFHTQVEPANDLQTRSLNTLEFTRELETTNLSSNLEFSERYTKDRNVADTHDSDDSFSSVNNESCEIQPEPESLVSLGQLSPEADAKKVTIKITSTEVPDSEPRSETFNSFTIQVLKNCQRYDAQLTQPPIIAYILKLDATLLDQRKRFRTVSDRLSTFSTIHKHIDVSSIEAASAGFIARQGIDPEYYSNTALLCLECSLLVDNLPCDVVIIAVHKAHSGKCKFILDFEQLNASADETAVVIPTPALNGAGAISTMVVAGMVTNSDQSFEENSEMSDVRRRYDHTVLNNSKFLPVPKADLTKGWTPLEMLDALPEERAVLNVLNIDPTIDGLSTMISEETRKESFRTYPNDLLLDIAQLCAAGQFWTGKENVMKCCGCGVEHSGWDKNVPPLTRHLQLSPNCVFLKRSFTSEYINSELLKIESPYTPPVPIPRKEKVTKRDVALYIDSRPYTNIRDNPEKFALKGATRRKFTAELYKAVEYMRKFNLPIPGKEPEVIEMLKEMRDRDEKELKSTITNTHTHVLDVVTHEFDENMQRQASELERQQKARKVQNNPERQQPLAASKDINANEIAQSMRCKICLDKLCGLLLLPCSHIATCAGCGMSQALCPICRGKVTATTSIRFF